MKNNGDFYALLFRMKNISRWGLMYNTRPENLSEHSFECALLSHALALIGNEIFGKSFDAERLLSAALLHDMSEVLTGDLPTPVKYYDDDIKKAYKSLEHVSEEKMLSLLEPVFADSYRKLLTLSEEETKLLKAADKLCAYIKCLQEKGRGNQEFSSAQTYIEKAIREMGLPELDYFMEHFLSSFMKNIDDVAL